MNTMKKRMAGRLEGSMATTAEERMAKAEAVMESGGLLIPLGPIKAKALANKVEPPQLGLLGGEVAPEPVSQKKASNPVAAAKKELRVQRETFTLLPQESDLIDQIRTQAAAAGLFTTRSAVVRAGVLALQALKGEQLLSVIKRVPVVKPGRK
jgi:hypothetical protein